MYFTMFTGNVNGDAVWSVQLNARAAGGPYNLTVSVQVTTLVLADVLFADIWLCRGQSNVEFSVPMVHFFLINYFHRFRNLEK